MLDAAHLHEVRRCLADHVGKTLTPEACHLIDQVLRFGPDRSVDPGRFESLEYKDYTIRVERFAKAVIDLHPLHVEHWQETEKHRHGLALNPDYDHMLARERAGRLVQFVARAADGVIAGHVRMYLGTSTHSGTLFAEEDTLFIRPQYRGTFLVMALMRYAERVLRALGAREIRADSKLLNRADVLMRRLGYTPVALKFHKFFEE